MYVYIMYYNNNTNNNVDVVNRGQKRAILPLALALFSSNFNFLCVLYFAKVCCTTKIHISCTGHKMCFVFACIALSPCIDDYRKNILHSMLFENVNSLSCLAIYSQSIFGRRECERPVGKSSVSQS